MIAKYCKSRSVTEWMFLGCQINAIAIVSSMFMVIDWEDMGAYMPQYPTNIRTSKPGKKMPIISGEMRMCSPELHDYVIAYMTEAARHCFYWIEQTNWTSIWRENTLHL